MKSACCHVKLQLMTTTLESISTTFAFQNTVQKTPYVSLQVAFLLHIYLQLFYIQTRPERLCLWEEYFSNNICTKDP